MLFNTKQYFKKAEDGEYAIGQFNCSTADQVKAVISAAKKLNAPVIIGTSEGEAKFMGLKQAVKIIESYQEETGLPIILNADHTYKDVKDLTNLDKIKELLDAGYNSIHFDGSVLPYEENVKWTSEVVKMCKEKNPEISVEGELGYLPGASKVTKEKVEIKEEYLTDSDQALEFVKATGIDRLAVSVGNSHGISFNEDKLQFERIANIKEKVGDLAVLVLHGGSGIPDEDIQKAVSLGICKININTELRIAFTDAFKKYFTENPDETTPYKYLDAPIEAMQKVVSGKIKVFGSENKAI